MSSIRSSKNTTLTNQREIVKAFTKSDTTILYQKPLDAPFIPLPQNSGTLAVVYSLFNRISTYTGPFFEINNGIESKSFRVISQARSFIAKGSQALITKWYDQSGNSYDAIAEPGSEPSLLFDDDKILTEEGAYIQVSDDKWLIYSDSSPITRAAYVVVNPILSPSFGGLIQGKNSGNTGIRIGGGSNYDGYDFGNDFKINGISTSTYTYSLWHTMSVTRGSNYTWNGGWNLFTAGGGFKGSRNWLGRCLEIIMFVDSPPLAERTLIQANQNEVFIK